VTGRGFALVVGHHPEVEHFQYVSDSFARAEEGLRLKATSSTARPRR